MQETIDGLNEEFAALSSKSLETGANIRELENELLNQTELLKTVPEDSSEHAQQRNVIRETTTKITHAKANLDAYTLKKGNCLQRLELFKKQLEEKKRQFQQRSSRSEAEIKQQATRKSTQQAARKVSQQPERKPSQQPQRKVSTSSKDQKKKPKK